jgi:hypothetical protein
MGAANRNRHGSKLTGRGADGARELLQPVFEQFVEGAETADLKAAKSLLASW